MTKKLKKELTPLELDTTDILKVFKFNFEDEIKYDLEILLNLDRYYKRRLILKDSYIFIYSSFNGWRPLTTKETFLLQLYL